MSDGSTIIASKLANAFVRDARPTATAQAFSSGVLKLFQKGFGGLWVGGTATLTPHRLDFAANRMNRALHENLSEVSIPLDRVTQVADRFGVLTRIIDVRLDDGSVFTFRCFGAPAFAKQIDAAVRAGRAA